MSVRFAAGSIMLMASVIIVACATPDANPSAVSVKTSHFDRVLKDRSRSVWHESVVNTTRDLVESGIYDLELVRKGVCERTAVEEVNARIAEVAWADAFAEMASASANAYAGVEPELQKAYEQDVKKLMRETIDRQFTTKRDILIEATYAEAMKQKTVAK